MGSNPTHGMENGDVAELGRRGLFQRQVNGGSNLLCGTRRIMEVTNETDRIGRTFRLINCYFWGILIGVGVPFLFPVLIATGLFIFRIGICMCIMVWTDYLLYSYGWWKLGPMDL